MTYIHHFFIISSFVLLFTGCSSHTGAPDNSSSFMKLSTTESIDQADSNHAKDLLNKHEEITAVHAVNSSKKMIVAFEVYHHDRLQLKKIKKRIQKEIKKEFPHLKTTVSTDKKIILELHRLEKQINENEFSKKEIDQKIKELMTLAKEQT